MEPKKTVKTLVMKLAEFCTIKLKIDYSHKSFVRFKPLIYCYWNHEKVSSLSVPRPVLLIYSLLKQLLARQLLAEYHPAYCKNEERFG